ncbi:MAG: hypothetical protein WCW78_02055 [Candidatus Paceibacterota bacterium]|jgi:hypothetical protein
MAKHISKFGFILFIVIFLFLTQNTERRSTEFVAKAASLNAIPKYCLGGWESPMNAAGQPDVSTDRGSEFTSENSAILSQKSAQLFCGIFESDDRSSSPTRAILHFSWRMDFVAHEDADAKLWQENIASSTEFVYESSPTSTPTSSQSTVNKVSDIDTSSTAITSMDSGVEMASSSSSSTSPILINEVPVSQSQITESTSTPAVSNDVPAPAAASTTPSEISPSVATTSATRSWYETMALMFTHKAFAEDVIPHAQPDFLEVMYAVDGKNWKSIGKVNESNWRDTTIDVPVTSWEEIDRLQIELVPLFSVDSPTIFVDGMWIQIQHENSLLGAIKGGASAVVDFTQSTSEVVNNAIDSAISAVTDVVANIASPQASLKDTQVIVQTAPQQEEQKKPKFNFGIGGDIPLATRIMPWVRSNEQKEDKGNNVQRIPTLTSDPIHNAFTISGSCSKPYFVILVFANQSDYLNDPSRAVINRAGLCVNSSFSYQLRSEDFPQNLPDGIYYAVAGEEGVSESWQPHSAIYPITISRIASSTNP